MLILFLIHHHLPMTQLIQVLLYLQFFYLPPFPFQLLSLSPFFLGILSKPSSIIKLKFLCNKITHLFRRPSEKSHIPCPYSYNSKVLFSFLLLASGVLCEEFAHEPTVTSSLLQLKHAASNTPIGLWGIDGADAVESLAESLINE